MNAVEGNSEVMEETALQARQESAQVMTHTLSQVAQESGNTLNGLDVEIKEVADPSNIGKELLVDEKITVTTMHGNKGRRRNQ
jgi:hypothetical protein